MSYTDFFRTITGNAPFPYQVRLAQGNWPEVIDVPTGLGKTVALIGAWLHRTLNRDRETGRRLVYCLPMRSLVHQTAEVARALCERAAEAFQARNLATPTVHTMLGGFVDESWEANPEQRAILIGTQDMLLSRALNRGYAMSRYKWPIHFALLHSDCLWVLDETQLMGVGVETTAQLAGLRRCLGAFPPAHTIWMSATLGRDQLRTVDHSEPAGGYRVLTLDATDRDSSFVRERVEARKKTHRAQVALTTLKEFERYATGLARFVAERHQQRGGLTLVVVNRVDRAQAIYGALSELNVAPLALIHSRFRLADRQRHEALMRTEGDRVIVATQAIEAGVDISARTLFSELAPWPSLVQRFGRCNRYGEEPDAHVYWMDLDAASDPSLALPYSAEELVEARGLLGGLTDVGPQRLAEVTYVPPRTVRPVLRNRDLVDLFDTSADLLGHDLDVSRFVRDGTDTDVSVYYRWFDGEPDPDAPAPSRDELVRVSLAAARVLLDRLKKKRQTLGDGEQDREKKRWLRAWIWDPLSSHAWSTASAIYAGQILMLHGGVGGYDANVGWTGEILTKTQVEAIPPDARAPSFRELMDSDPRTAIDRWVTLREHLSDVEDEASKLAATLSLPPRFRAAVTVAALWHDLGKVHPEFQRRLIEPVEDDPRLKAPSAGPWAKSSHKRRPPLDTRPYFRHELASALAWLQCSAGHVDSDLIAYLIAAHHGKVRLTIRSIPDEQQPPDADRLFARGIWQGDHLPAVEMPSGITVGPIEIDLSPMRLGQGSWLERTLRLRDDPEIGPFRLAFLEALVRVADWRASDKERNRA